MSYQQASAGASMSDEHVINKHSDYQDAPTTDQQAPEDTITPRTQTHSPTSADGKQGKVLLNDPVKTYDLMLKSFSEGKTHEGKNLAQQLVLSGTYPEIVHARLFLAQGTQDALIHADKAIDEAASAIARYGEKDNEKLKLLDLALRTLAQVKVREGLGVIEEVDEEEARVKDSEEAVGGHEE